MSLQGKGILWMTKTAKKEGTVGLKDKLGINLVSSHEKTPTDWVLALQNCLARAINHPKNLTVDCPEAGGDGNAHTSNSAKARGLLLPEDGNAFQPVVLTLLVCVSSKKGITSTCKLRNMVFTEFGHLRVKATHAIAVWALSANACLDDDFNYLIR